MSLPGWRPARRLSLALLSLAFTAVACATPYFPSEDVPAHLVAAVDHPDRHPEDVQRDADRKPGEVLAFFQIEPGMKVVDLMAGGGYYTELVARAVGPEGAVYAHDTAWKIQKYGERRLTEVRSKPGLGHIKRWVQDLDDPKLPEGQLDAALLLLFYHDTFWQEVDREAMNRAIFRALTPGGVYGVIDHTAEPGSGDRDVETLHRGDPDLIREEILAAGFVLEEESDLLRNPEDDRTRNVFAPFLRGKTDRFVYRFRKPFGP
ncbi:MAG: methyltransferase domain-containing protein [Myxococcota bacterium]